MEAFGLVYNPKIPTPSLWIALPPMVGCGGWVVSPSYLPP